MVAVIFLLLPRCRFCDLFADVSSIHLSLFDASSALSEPFQNKYEKTAPDWLMLQLWHFLEQPIHLESVARKRKTQ